MIYTDFPEFFYKDTDEQVPDGEPIGLDVDNNEDNVEDDTVLLEDETEIDPIAEGIKPKDDGEEEY